MTRILILLAGLFFAGESFALPPCPTSGYWDNCYGTYTWADGRKYVGEYKNGKPREGIMYLASGEIAGTYSNGKACKGCTPTARQLAIVRAINSGQIATTPTPSNY